MRTGGLALAVALLGGCQSTRADLESLAGQAPLPYSVLVTGGAFAEVPAPGGSGAMGRTFDAAPDGEAIPLQDLVEVLRLGRVFVRVSGDPGSRDLRRSIARLSGPVPVEATDLQELLAGARADGHDLLLVVERLQDGRVDQQGINGSWPITLSVWLLLGLGMFIPDHTFQSRANLDVSLRDVQTGRVLYGTVRDGGPVDLSLVERGSVLGIITSIIVPPFWIPNHEESTVASVRSESVRRLLASVAGQLKGVEAAQELADRTAARIDVETGPGSLLLRIDAPSAESLAVVRLRIDSRPLEGPALDQLERELLASARLLADGSLRYQTRYRPPEGAELLQVLVRTTSGRVASETVRVRDP